MPGCGQGPGKSKGCLVSYSGGPRAFRRWIASTVLEFGRRHEPQDPLSSSGSSCVRQRSGKGKKKKESAT